MALMPGGQRHGSGAQSGVALAEPIADVAQMVEAHAFDQFHQAGLAGDGDSIKVTFIPEVLRQHQSKEAQPLSPAQVEQPIVLPGVYRQLLHREQGQAAGVDPEESALHQQHAGSRVCGKVAEELRLPPRDGVGINCGSGQRKILQSHSAIVCPVLTRGWTDRSMALA